MKKIFLLFIVSITLTSCLGGKEAKTFVADIIKNSPIEGEITVSCYDVMYYADYLKAAAWDFERKFPGTKVNIEVFGKHPEVVTRELDDGSFVSLPVDTDDTGARNDYKYKVATQLMAGKGADIYAFDILPVHDYQGGDIFENLREYMEGDPDFDMTKYRGNIFDALTIDNEQIIMPLDYWFFCFFYNKKLFSQAQGEEISALTAVSYDNLADMAREVFISQDISVNTNDYMWGDMHPGAPRYALNGQQLFNGSFNSLGLYSGLFYYDYNEFIDTRNKKANFTDGKFVASLNKIDEYADLSYIKASAKRPNTAAKYKEALSEDIKEDFFFSPRWYCDIFNMLSYRETEFDIHIPPKTNENGFAGIIANNKGDVPFQYRYAFGINENSENKKMAWEFIKYMLSDEGQMIGGFVDIPVNKNAFINRTKKRISSQALTLLENIVLNPDEQQIFDEYTALIDRYTERINTYIYVDPIALNMVETEVDAYFKGEKTAEDIARILQGKLTLYLSE